MQQSLEAITKACETGKGNLLALAVDAAQKRATLGEISYACEKVYGRYKAVIRSISGVYSSEAGQEGSFKEAHQLADEFAEMEGRRPRIMIAKMGQDGHDRGAKVVATGYADIGFDVDIGPLFQTPAEAARQAVENDVHMLGVSSLAAGHKTLVPQVIEELKKLGREDIMVIVGGVIPAQDYQFLYDAGVVAIFGPGTVISEAGVKMLELLIEARKLSQLMRLILIAYALLLLNFSYVRIHSQFCSIIYFGMVKKLISALASTTTSTKKMVT